MAISDTTRQLLVTFLSTILSTDGQRTLTTFSYVQQLLTWNEAYLVCVERGGYLAQPIDEATNNAVFQRLRQTDATRGCSIGLISSELTPFDLKWATGCGNVTWHYLDPASRTLQEHYCWKITLDLKWRETDCKNMRNYMCEFKSDTVCPYKLMPNMTLSENRLPLINSTTYNIVSKDLCQKWCTVDLDCWAFNFNKSLSRCRLYTTNNPEGITQALTDSSTSLFIKDCFRFEQGKPYNLTTAHSRSITPIVNCSMQPTPDNSSMNQSTGFRPTTAPGDTSDGQRTLTTFSYVQQLLTWNEAYLVCVERGGYLAQPIDEATNNAVFRRLRQTDVTEGCSIGLISSELNPFDLKWATGCGNVTWHYLDPASRALQEQYCWKITLDLKWREADCTKLRNYMCEFKSDTVCPYKLMPNMTLSGNRLSLINSTTYNILYKDLCQKRCTVDLDCWAFNFNKSLSRCRLYTTNNPESITQALTNSSRSLFIKDCFRFEQGEPYNLTTAHSRSITPIVNCSMQPTPDKSSMNQSTGFRSTSVSGDTSALWTYFKTMAYSFNSLKQDYEILPTTAAFQTRPTERHETGSQENEASYTLPNSTRLGKVRTDATGISSTTILSTVSGEDLDSSTIRPTVIGNKITPKNMDCSCLCVPTNHTKGLKDVFLGQLLAELTIQKTSLSSARRKYYSVPDDRPVAVSIGCFGIAILVAFLFFIAFIDIFTFCK